MVDVHLDIHDERSSLIITEDGFTRSSGFRHIGALRISKHQRVGRYMIDLTDHFSAEPAIEYLERKFNDGT